MQIVINIDNEYVLADIRDRTFEPQSETDRIIIEALYNGIPLPKVHGRLIDADYVLNKMETTDAQPITYAENYAFDFAKTMFREAPTIIEADKE